MNRREFLTKAGIGAAGVVSGLASGSAMGQWLGLGGQKAQPAGPSRGEDDYDLIFPRVRFASDSNTPDNWSAYPGADKNMLEEFSAVVRCKVKMPQSSDGWTPHNGTPEQFSSLVDFNNTESLRRYPILFMTSEGNFTFNQVQKQNMERYVREGGFLLMDDCVYGNTGDYFYVAAVRLLTEVFGKEAVQPVGNDHEIFHNVFDFSKTGLPFMQGQQHAAMGVFIGDRLAVLLSSGDLHCGWADRTGSIFGGGRNGRQGYKQAVQMGVNIVTYALSH